MPATPLSPPRITGSGTSRNPSSRTAPAQPAGARRRSGETRSTKPRTSGLRTGRNPEERETIPASEGSCRGGDRNQKILLDFLGFGLWCLEEGFGLGFDFEFEFEFGGLMVL